MPSGTGYYGAAYPCPTGRHHRGHCERPWKTGGVHHATGTGMMPRPTGGRFIREGFTGPKVGKPKVVKEEEVKDMIREGKERGRGWLSGLI